MGTLADRLQKVLAAHRVALSADEFLELLAEASDDTSPLTAAESDFLTAHSGIDPSKLEAGHRLAAAQTIASDTAGADAAVTASSYTTNAVAALLNMAAPNVRRAIVRGDLYVAGRSRNREHLFPAWQFRGDRPLPHLAAVLAALPAGMHPLDVQAVMTTACEPLGNRSPADWLDSGGDPEPVVDYITDLDRW